jgi:C-terminal processing protease CtpA/Prc
LDTHPINRRTLLVALASAPWLAAAGAGPDLTERQRLEDFDSLWTALDEGYAYFGTTGRGEWSRARETGRAKARAARSRAEFAAALERTLQRLHEDHVWMSEHSPGAARRVPSETDIWASWRNDAAVIEAVRTYGDADVAGVRPGHVVRSIGGQPVPMALRDWAGRERDAGTLDWALRHALAGPREGILRLEIAEAQGPRAYDIERSNRGATPGAALIARRVGEQRDVGYLRIKAGLSDATLASRFDGAMRHLDGTRAMILDLRDATGPFDDPTRSRATTMAMLQRFAKRPGPWQAREVRAGERVVDAVTPADKPYAAPLVVLVDRWTAGEGEALAAGLQAVAGAQLVGTRMAGLRGELRGVRLRHSGITVRYPAQKTYRADGTPRESLMPDILVDLAAPQGGPGDPILYQGMKRLEK